MAYFDELLQRAITVRNNRAPASNTADLVGGVLVGIVTALQMLLDDKQDELTFDTAPTADSQNPVTSDGIYQALQAIDLSACEKIVNKVTSINAQSTDVQYPTAKLLYDSLQALSGIYAAIVHTHAIADIINLQTELDARQLVSNLVTAITAQSTDQQYPSAKLLYDQLQGLAAVYAPKVHTHPFADIERPANVASVNAQGYTITTAYYSHVLTITADATLHLPTMQSGAAIILRLTIIQDATGGRAVSFDGGAALVFNPYQTDLSLGQANYRCWVVLWFDGVNWAWLASPYVLRAESQFAYTIDGTTGGQYVTVTINGTTMQIQATSGVWQYGYNNPINSIAFTGDTGVLNVDFTNSDGLANITTLADAFKNCAALVAVDFTGCDLSNVATAADCFAGCTSLTALTIPTGTWKPDIDLSACAAFTKAAMLAVIDGLYTYASGTHTVTFNSTAWDALSVADQQQVYNAADAKGWTTNAVAVTYVIRGKSTAASESFNIQFIKDNAQSPDPAETITVTVDGNGDWSYSYSGKKIYSAKKAFLSNSTITNIEFSEDFAECVDISQIFNAMTKVQTINMPNASFAKALDCSYAFCQYANNNMLQSISIPSATFASITNAYCMLAGITHLSHSLTIAATFATVTNAGRMFIDSTFDIALPNATFASATDCSEMFSGYKGSFSMPSATFASATNITKFCLNYTGASIDLPCATFEKVTTATQAFNLLPNCTIIEMPNATFERVTTANAIFSQYNTVHLATIYMPNATFESLQSGGNNANLFGAGFTRTLQNFTVAANKLKVSMNMSGPNLTYQSMVNVANWLADLTGLSAQTITFYTTAWNALTAAEQATIQGILQAKNWNLATA